MRVKGVHIVNQPYIFNMLFAIFKPFLREKLRSRIHFHGFNLSSLQQHINPAALRKRHGGLLPEPEIPGDVLWKMLYHYEEQFKCEFSSLITISISIYLIDLKFVMHIPLTRLTSTKNRCYIRVNETSWKPRPPAS